MNNDNNEKKVEIVDSNLLNPFQNNVNNNSQSLNNSFVNDNQKNNISSTSSNGVNNNAVPSIQNDVNSSNESVNNLMQSSISEINNSTTLENNTTNNNDINKKIQSPVNVKSINDNMSNSANTSEQSCSFFLILAVVSIFGFFTGGILTIIGIILCVISLIGSIVMLNKKAKLSGVSLGVSLIILIIYILSFILSFKAVNSFVDQTKASVFRDYAISFSIEAKQKALVNNKISCDDGSVKSIREPLPELPNGGKVSPFGGNYDYNSSYVLVEANEINGRCQYKSSIYLTDGKYSIGTVSNPVSENDINSVSITKN